MLLEACVTTIGLLILQGFHVKQWDIYDNNYYLLFARISYPLLNVCGDKEVWDSFVLFFLILQDFLNQKGDYERLFKRVQAWRGNKVAGTSPPK
jgi:hypothetical protein